MNTLFLLMAQYEGRAVIPLERVCSDYMHLTVEKFKRKRLDGEIDIPVVRLGADSQKAALGIYLKDLADYIDRQREKAAKEQNQLMGRAKKNVTIGKDNVPDIPHHPAQK